MFDGRLNLHSLLRETEERRTISFFLGTKKDK